MNRSINTILVTAVICLAMSGCGSRNSGLYHLTGDGSTHSVMSTNGDGSPDDAVSNGEAAADNAASGQTEASGKPAASDVSSADKDVSAAGNVPSSDIAIYVHICGAVRNPGVYELNTGDRVIDAVKCAGGFTDAADEAYINLAMALQDGMKITVPTLEETAEFELLPEKVIETDGASEAAGNSITPSGTMSTDNDTAAGTGGRININTADTAQLMTVTGIGQTRAAAIIAYRNEHGAFASTEEIKNVSGIGDATYEKLKDQITTGD
ncbi:MAG: ComEA family DNA-binding protein [Lachnospiraceae bacterium]|nr:ComEA family DNA-binding protein [Lachnospiraceae bacterium]